MVTSPASLPLSSIPPPSPQHPARGGSVFDSAQLLDGRARFYGIRHQGELYRLRQTWQGKLD